MATLPQNPPLSLLSKETTSDYPHLSGWGDYREYTRYSPSILVVADNLASLAQLKQWLESKGCQVSGVNLNSNKLASVSQRYFDLMIIDLEAFEGLGAPKNNESLLAVVQKLKAYAGLSSLPLIILTNCDEIRANLTHSVDGPLYCLGKGPATEAILLQIVAQIHYLSYRYV